MPTFINWEYISNIFKKSAYNNVILFLKNTVTKTKKYCYHLPFSSSDASYIYFSANTRNLSYYLKLIIKQFHVIL